MNVYTNTSCTGHYPIGFAAVVIAPDTVTAAQLLNAELKKEGLDETALPAQMELLCDTNSTVPSAEILVNGNY